MHIIEVGQMQKEHNYDIDYVGHKRAGSPTVSIDIFELSRIMYSAIQDTIHIHT